MRMKRLGLLAATALVLAGPSLAAVKPHGAAIYRNPILPADYSDPDVIRVGDTYYLVASSFHFSPGVPILTSKDLVHWTIAGHVLPKLPFAPEYDLPGPVPTNDAGARMPRELRTSGQRYAGGVWRPRSATTTASSTSISPPPMRGSSCRPRPGPGDPGQPRWRW